MTIQTQQFDARELCSRKLWQLVNTRTDGAVSDTEVKQAVAELAARRHYLEELKQLGKLGQH